jgi:hypothetical protein
MPAPDERFMAVTYIGMRNPDLVFRKVQSFKFPHGEGQKPQPVFSWPDKKCKILTATFAVLTKSGQLL